MKYWFAAVLAFLAMAGASCALFSHAAPAAVAVPPVSATENISDLVGIVDVINQTARSFSLVLPDQSAENVGFGQNIDLSGLKSGMLVRVDGTRDRSTRLINPTSIAVDQQTGIRLTSPTVDATVTSPLIAFGFAKSDTGSIHWRLRASNGDMRSEGDAPVAPVVPGGFGAFRLDLFLPAMKDLDFSLEVSLRARNGAEQQAVSVPLHLLSADTTTFNVYFANTAKGSLRNCSLVFPVQRTVAKTSAVAHAAAQELLKGPTAEERSQGFVSFFPANAVLRSLSVNGSTAATDFAGTLASVAGACKTAAVRAQIAQTLIQFPPISTVAVTVEGKAIPAFQP